MRTREPRRVSYSFMTADLLHYGHVRILRRARESADYHICGLLSDEASSSWQGVSICNYEERKAVLEAMDCVDEVIKQDVLDPTSNLMRIRERFPNSKIVVVHGDDWKTVPGREYIESIGGEIVQPEYYSRLSRNAIIERFKRLAAPHPEGREPLPHHFRVGNIVRFDAQAAGKLLSTKADTLKNFQPLLVSSKIEKLFVCSVNDYQEYGADIIGKIQDQFLGCTLIVRSSSANEDLYQCSRAGYYLSVGDVDSSDGEGIRLAIEKVVDSYGKDGCTRPDDQILIQSQSTDIRTSGVVFTRNLQTNTPYYVINYDDETGKTDSVTGGGTSKTVRLYRGDDVIVRSKRWKSLITAVKEIEAYLPGMVLDIEFAEQTDGTVVIFQIRPLAANVRYSEFDDEKFRALIDGQVGRYREAGGGERFLSDMAFWNPSEIISDNPHPLDYSLYREIITSRAWSTGLTPLGYSPVKYELMEQYGNKPYINLDHAFACLIPRSLGKGLRDRLREYYKDRLRADLTAHDKIEFEIALSCYDFETDSRLEGLRAAGFSEGETAKIARALTELTLFTIKGYRQRLKTDLADIKRLLDETERLAGALGKGSTAFDHIDCFNRLVDNIKRYGTPQFTTVAREAFIAKSLCRGMVGTGIFSEDEVNRFLDGITTVASDFDRDFHRFACKEMDEEEFMGRYGHLRAGTYDITSSRYDRMDFSSLSRNLRICQTHQAGRPAAGLDKKRLGAALRESAFSDITPGEFVHFIKSSIEQREYFKFEFTKSLSLALELLARAGELLGFSREELSYLEVPWIKVCRFYADERELAGFWRMAIEGRKAVYAENSALELPPVIQTDEDFFVVSSMVSRPNFITQKRVSGEVVNLDQEHNADIKDKIVLITRADPGYDWIFTQDIRGLVTEYGGAASHMAIRCAEFNVPAAIGCGGQIYNSISAWRRLRLDCKRKKILQLP